MPWDYELNLDTDGRSDADILDDFSWQVLLGTPGYDIRTVGGLKAINMARAGGSTAVLRNSINAIGSVRNVEVYAKVIIGLSSTASFKKGILVRDNTVSNTDATFYFGFPNAINANNIRRHTNTGTPDGWVTIGTSTSSDAPDQTWIWCWLSIVDDNLQYTSWQGAIGDEPATPDINITNSVNDAAGTVGFFYRDNSGSRQLAINQIYVRVLDGTRRPSGLLMPF